MIHIAGKIYPSADSHWSGVHVRVFRTGVLGTNYKFISENVQQRLHGNGGIRETQVLNRPLCKLERFGNELWISSDTSQKTDPCIH